MRGNELLDKMALIDPAYVQAADTAPKKKKGVWVKWGVAAACLALTVFAGTRFLPSDEPEQRPDLPMLSISENPAGMGYEGYMAYDISELVNANPWNQDSRISALPVFQNPLTSDEQFTPSKADLDQIKAFLLDIAERLGLDTNALTITSNTSDEDSQQQTTEIHQSAGTAGLPGYIEPTKLIAEAEGIKIEVDSYRKAVVTFDPAVPLPEEYNFTFFASYDDKVAAAQYLKSKYADFIAMDNPQANIYGGDYNIYNQQMYSIEFFEVAENETEQLIHYNFNRVAFACNTEGRLFIARVYQPDLSVKMGDYPIISWKQAKNMLLKGKYITSVPYGISEEKQIKKVELVYRTGEHEEYFMPYYRFYAQLPEEARENGLNTYGAYYVPAVESSYISNMPVWDGGFNS